MWRGLAASSSIFLRSFTTKLSTLRVPGVPRHAPDLLEDLLARDRLPRPLPQQAQELDLVERQRVRLPFAGQLLLVRIDDGAADLDALRRRRGEAVQAPEHGVDARDQLTDRERLGDVVVGARVQPADLVGLLRPRGQHDHRHQRVRRSDLLAHGKAVRVRQHEVQQHQVRPALAQQPHALAPGPRGHHLEALELQRGAQPAHQIGFVLDDQDAPPPREASRCRQARHDATRSSGAGVMIGATGMYTVKVDPRPGALSTSMRPPWASAMCLTSASPMPLPRTLRARAFSAR